MKNLFINYQIAKELKQIGFDDPCLVGLNGSNKMNHKLASRIGSNCEISWDKNDDGIPLPLYQQATDWFREKHNLNIVITKNKFWVCEIYNINTSKLISGYSTNETYYQALNQAIQESIKLIKK